MNLPPVVYVINQYPKVSHSFIRREIAALERAGVKVHRVAVRGWDGELVDPEDEKERFKTRYLLKGGLVPLLVATLRTAYLAPIGWAKSLGLAVKMSRKAERSLPYHLVYWAQACLLAQWVKQVNASHLHAHFGTNSAEVAMLAAIVMGGTYSLTVHGPEEFDKPAALGLAEKVRRSAFVVAISSYGRSQLYRWLDVSDWHKVRVVHCGLDRSLYNRSPAQVTELPHFVCVGRLCEQKGQLLLLEAAYLLLRRGIPFMITFAGEGEMRATIENRVRALGLGQTVKITGWLSNEDVRRELQAARALALPSFAEGLPVVLMEAMALRRPVISTYVAGIPELVIPGQHGWLVPAGDVVALADAMQECLEMSLADLKHMGEQAHQRVLSRHDIDETAAQLITAFQLGEVRQAVTVETPTCI
ncbi:MAG: glycosyl transferase group 1 family protein [Herminiimonas sp.]|nr:glycosyl transferase group 1 family protein [Herminiimonas sp.]